MNNCLIHKPNIKMSGWETIIAILEWVLPLVLEDPWKTRVVVAAKIIVAIIVMIFAIKASLSDWI